MEWFVALRYLRGKRKTGFITFISLLSAGAVFLGTLVLVCALSIANGFEKEVRDRIVGTLAHGQLERYHRHPITDTDSLIGVVESHPKVVAAAPYLDGEGAIEFNDVVQGIKIMGVDGAREPNVTILAEKTINGAFRLDSVESARGRHFPGICIGDGLAKVLGVVPGHEVVLMSLALNGGGMDPTPRYERYTVTGIFETGYYEYDALLVYIGIDAAETLLGVDGARGIHYRTSDLFASQQIKKELLDLVGHYPYWVRDWRERNKSLFDWMRLEKFIIFSVISLIIVVASFNIVSSLVMMILEKRREIGVLMGLGATSGSVMRVFMFNGMVVGCLGATIGTLLGSLICYIQYRWQLIPIPGDIYFISKLPVLIRPLDVVSVFVSANLMCWLATLYPAWKASTILPAESIRFD